MNKICRICQQTLPLTAEYFYLRRDAKDGFQAACKKCEYQRKKAYKESPEAKAAAKQYYAKWLASNPDYHKAWRAENPNYYAKWAAKNPGYSNAAVKKWEKESLTPEQYKQRNKVKAHRRRARALSAGGKFTKNDVLKILEAQKGQCWWCNVKLSAYHIDHRIPLSKGGSNGPENIVLSCPRCNCTKSAKMPWELKDNPRLV